MKRYIPNFNTATKEELERIPGIGKDIADAIIRYRDEMGGVQSFEELMNAEGITQNHVDRLRSWLQIDEDVHQG